MPIQIVNVIEAKREEAKRKTWQVQYHARLIERLRSFKEEAIDDRPWFQRLFS